MTKLDELLDRMVAAHGGAALWRGLTAIDALFDAGGFLFTLKHRPLQRRARLRAFTREPRVDLLDYPGPGLRGEWHGEDEVRIVDAGGQVVARRERPRAQFASFRRQLWWDELDFLFFGAYAFWNYLTLPLLLGREGVALKLLEPLPGDVQRVHATFPPGLPTHSREQEFHFAPSGELLRHDYTADVVGGWATAAHLSSGYRDFGGLRAPTVRRVRPTFFGSSPLPFPTIVAIDVHELTPVRAG